jgi:hypothetical protein
LDKTTGKIKSASEGRSKSGKKRSRGPKSAARTGDHTTAHATFSDMVINHVIGKTVAAARDALDNLVTALLSLPGARGGDAPAVKRNEGIVRALIAAAKNVRLLGSAMREIVKLRNIIPGTSVSNPKSTGGHGEAGNAAELHSAEAALRRAGPLRKGVDDDYLAKCASRLFDPGARKNAATDAATKDLTGHVISMRLSYPLVMLRLGPKFLSAFQTYCTGAGLGPAGDPAVWAQVAAAFAGAPSSSSGAGAGSSGGGAGAGASGGGGGGAGTSGGGGAGGSASSSSSSSSSISPREAAWRKTVGARLAEMNVTPETVDLLAGGTPSLATIRSLTLTQLKHFVPNGKDAENIYLEMRPA